MKRIIGFFIGVAVCFGLLSAPCAAASAYTDVVGTEYGLAIAPAVVVEAEDRDGFFRALDGEEKPGSMIFGADETLGAVAKNGEGLGSLGEVLQALSENCILPVIRLADVAQASFFAGYASENSLADYCIVGTDAETLETAKSRLPQARVCFDFSGGQGYAEPYSYIGISRRVGAHIVLLSESQADFDTVYYLQGMLTTVWLSLSDGSEVGIADAVSRGVYGIVSDGSADVYGVYDKYPFDSIPRGYYNIGHRGLPLTENENSLEGCIAAYEAGATHLEIDIKVTADDRLVIMHDDTIDRTTNGSGSVGSMTLEQLSRYKITKTYKGETTGQPSDIPTLDEIFSYFKDEDVILVAEIKTTNSDCPRLLKECIENYEIEDQVVVISFYEQQLQLLHELMPEVPSATLNTVDESSLEEYIAKAAEWNFCFDLPYRTSYTLLDGNLKNRGYMDWCWTYEGAKAVRDAAGMGVTGITNNNADAFSGSVKKLIPVGGLTIGEEEDIMNMDFSAELLTFGGERSTVEAGVFLWERTERGYRVILRCYDDGVWLYSGAAEVLFEKSGETTSGASGCGSAFGPVSYILPVAFVAALLKNRKRRTDV